jgi:hypothetical protein
MKPPIDGYLRRLPEVDDATDAHLIANLAAYTEAEGFSCPPTLTQNGGHQ